MAITINTDGQPSSTIPDLSGSNTTLYPEYKCRAWVNFNGTGTVAIRGSGNVTSITDNNTGDYTINFTTAMPDANYSFSGSTRILVSDLDLSTARTVNLFRITTYNSTFNPADYAVVNICVFR